MAYKDMHEFIVKLKERNELIEITTPVTDDLEITEISNRVMKSKDYNKALLFTNIENRKYPLLINAFGSKERLNIAFNEDNFADIGNDIGAFMQLSKYKGLKNQIKAIPSLSRLYFSFPFKRKFKRAPCQEVVESPNLAHFPILKCWPEDGGRFFTLPLVFTVDPETNQQNIGMYRMQVFDHRTTGMHWHLHKDGKEIYEKYRKLGYKRMPVSVVVGCDPATIYSATAPLPKMIDEAMFASFLRKSPLSMTKCITNDIYVPSHAEFVFEGYVELDEDYRLEGPFGDHTGYYSLADYYPTFHIEKITRKENPIFNATIVGFPPMEDCYLSYATEKIFQPLMRLTLPELIDMHLPFEGVFHNLCVTKMQTSYPKHAQKLMYNFWGLGQMMYQKMICVFDESVDLEDYSSLIEKVIINVDLKEDLILTDGPLDTLDHSSNKPYFGTRVGIDVTTKHEFEKHATMNYPLEYTDISLLTDALETSDLPINDFYFPAIQDQHLILMIQAEKQSKEDIEKIQEFVANNPIAKQVKWTFIFDQYTDIYDMSVVAWRLFNNIDGKRDFRFSQYDEMTTIVIDATRKLPTENGGRKWPNDIVMDEEIIKLVDEKWDSYGIH
ncbi:MAG: menaquinone biosynthesis decarboxylase [Mycoplasmatales bacterium]